MVTSNAARDNGKRIQRPFLQEKWNQQPAMASRLCNALFRIRRNGVWRIHRQQFLPTRLCSRLKPDPSRHREGREGRGRMPKGDVAWDTCIDINKNSYFARLISYDSMTVRMKGLLDKTGESRRFLRSRRELPKFKR